MTPTPAQPVPPDPRPEPPPPTLLSAERLAFARWLVTHGRLSEWPDAPYTQGVERAHAESSAGPAGVQR